MPLIVLRGLLFDLDGTLTRPRLDFRAIRREIGVPDGASILEFLDGLHGPDLQTATDILDRLENGIDKFEDVFDIIQGIIIKYR